MFKDTLRMIAVSLITLSVIGVAFAAWTEPSQTPPQDNELPPLTSSSADQIKIGNLQVNGLAISGSGLSLYVPGGNVGIGTNTPSQKLDVVGNVKGTGLCIGADCRTTWPMSGGITSLSAGTGITLSPTNPITSTGTISVNASETQKRVNGTCGVDQAIKKINIDGTVVCQNIPPSATCVWGSRSYSVNAMCYSGTCPGYGTYYNGYKCLSTGQWQNSNCSVVSNSQTCL